jgi:hypothetical protein
MRWQKSWRADPLANTLAKHHYTCQSPDSAQFVPPGRCLVLRTPEADAVWVTSWPIADYVKHAWAGAWVCSLFRNESTGRVLSSALIRDAVAATRWYWPHVPPLGMVTFVDASKTRRKRDPGRCYVKAGWTRLQERTKEDGLIVLQLRPEQMGAPEPPIGGQLSLLGQLGA